MEQKPEIVFEDPYMLVIYKPAGLIVNKADTTGGIYTVQDWVDQNILLNRKDLDNYEEFRTRSGIVHRLDKETSGLMMIAKDNISFVTLQKEFKESRVSKTYIALSHGKVEQSEGEINVPIGRLPWDRKKFGVIPMGRESQTFYKVLECKVLKKGKEEEILTLLELHPKTGRTHQIRVHLRYINHPIFGDPLYAGRKNTKSDRKLLPRQFLHAAELKFYHPKTDKEMDFKSPLPTELVDFLSQLK